MANMTPRRKRNLKARLLAEYGPVCWYCKEQFPAEALTFEHLKAKSKGGPNSYENLRLACFPCNFGRHHPEHGRLASLAKHPGERQRGTTTSTMPRDAASITHGDSVDIFLAERKFWNSDDMTDEHGLLQVYKVENGFKYCVTFHSGAGASCWTLFPTLADAKADMHKFFTDLIEQWENDMGDFYCENMNDED